MIKVAQVIADASLGGGPKHVLSLVKNFDDKSINNIIISSSNGPEFIEEVKSHGIKVHTVDLMASRINFKNLLKLNKILEEEKIDIVHAHGTRAAFYIGILSLIKPIKFVYTVHGFSYRRGVKTLKNQLSMQVERFIANKSKKVISVSDTDRKDAIQIGILKQSNSTTIYNSVDDKEFLKKKILNFNKETIKICTIGRFVEQKGYEYLIKAIPEIIKKKPNSEFILIGDGPLKNEMEYLSKELGVNQYIKFLGYRNDVSKILVNSDIFVLPSLWEGLPISVIEALASKVPVVATSVNGTVEIVESGSSGVLVRPKDVEELAQAIVDILENEKTAVQYAEEGYKTFNEKFTLSQMIDKTINIYNNISKG